MLGALRRVKIIGFDLDGTLYPYTEEIQRRNSEEIYGELSKILGISFDKVDEVFNRLYNDRNESCCGSGSRTIERMGIMYGYKLNGAEIVQKCLARANVLDLIDGNPKLVEMLISLSKRYCLDLVTSTHSSLMNPKLEKIGIGKALFDYILTGETISKSDGAMFRRWLELRCFEADEHLYVGDNNRVDVDIPKGLGIRTCFIGEYEEADLCIGGITELESILKAD